jgi:hypothetical protein
MRAVAVASYYSYACTAGYPNRYRYDRQYVCRSSCSREVQSAIGTPSLPSSHATTEYWKWAVSERREKFTMGW